MAGYLDQYGAGEERREKIIKTAGDLAGVVGGGRRRRFLRFS